MLARYTPSEEIMKDIYFAKAERRTPAEINEEIKLIDESSFIDYLKTTIGGLLAILTEN
jgi:hypothetical protein